MDGTMHALVHYYVVGHEIQREVQNKRILSIWKAVGKCRTISQMLAIFTNHRLSHGPAVLVHMDLDIEL